MYQKTAPGGVTCEAKCNHGRDDDTEYSMRIDVQKLIFDPHFSSHHQIIRPGILQGLADPVVAGSLFGKGDYFSL